MKLNDEGEGNDNKSGPSSHMYKFFMIGHETVRDKLKTRLWHHTSLIILLVLLSPCAADGNWDATCAGSTYCAADHACCCEDDICSDECVRTDKYQCCGCDLQGICAACINDDFCVGNSQEGYDCEVSDIVDFLKYFVGPSAIFIVAVFVFLLIISFPMLLALAVAGFERLRRRYGLRIYTDSIRYDMLSN